MHPRILPALAIVLSAFAAACDPAFWLTGTIKSPAGPLAGAEITLACPGYTTQPVTSSADGRITFHQVPSIDPECRVRITKPGFRAHEITVASICHSHFGLTCRQATLEVELVPER
ncbi:Hypothetical protein A7982_11524 [Minicystis rosea]|nr:Hypothetical protein A7982_11524 [Minicystis rosea]